MKAYHISILFLLSVLFSCSTSNSKSENSSEKLIPQQKLDISNALNLWHQAAANADFDTYFGYLDEESIYVGTDAVEVWTKSDFELFSKPFFDRGRAWSFKAKSRNIYMIENNNIAYFDEVLDTWMGECRGSGVVQLNDKGNWIIKHYVLSLIIPNNRMKKVVQLLSDTSKINNIILK